MDIEYGSFHWIIAKNDLKIQDLFQPIFLLAIIERRWLKFFAIDTSNDEDFDFVPFSFLNMPKEFLRFGSKPFDMPIHKIEDLLIFDAFDYNYLINNYDQVSGEIVLLDDENEIKKNNRNLMKCDDENLIGNFMSAFYGKKNFPSIILFVGKYASLLFVIDQEYFASFTPFYLDKYGCPDIGYKRAQPLFLNDEKYERFIDTILSGDFANFLLPISRLMNR